jgi:hypothetical protein
LSWQETTGITGIYHGYKWDGSFLKRWGANVVEGTKIITYENGVKTSVLFTQFRMGRAQATVGDSGGGVFLDDGTLAGIMISVSQVSGQPANTSIFSPGMVRSETYVADVSVYRAQILAAIAAAPVPEPGVARLLGLALLAACGGMVARKGPAAPR